MEIAFDPAQGKITWDEVLGGGGYEIQYTLDTPQPVWLTWFSTSDDSICECSFNRSIPGPGNYKARGKSNIGSWGSVININIIG